MTLNLKTPKQPPDLRPRIVVLGVGGAGCNAVNNMIEAQLEGVECVVANTDAQSLSQALAERKVQLGMNITQGLGAGSRPEIGRAAAEEGLDDIIAHLQGAHMAFITAGMGGGTGTGAAPVIARAAREQGVLTVGVVTKPFHFEGQHRMRLAEGGIEELAQVVDTLIVIPNQNLFRVANEKTTFADAFHMADDVLYSGVRGITDLMVMPGLINLDFADIRTVMGEMGKAMMGAGEADGEDRAVKAAEAAISNPLLDDVSMAGARGLLINITGGDDLTLYEVDEAANRVRDEVDPAANIIFGSALDSTLEGKIRVSVFATGIDGQAMAAPRDVPVKVMATAKAETPVPAQAEIEEDDFEIAETPEDDFDIPETASEHGQAETRDAAQGPAQVDMFTAPAAAAPAGSPIAREHDAEEEADLPSRADAPFETTSDDLDRFDMRATPEDRTREVKREPEAGAEDDGEDDGEDDEQPRHKERLFSLRRHLRRRKEDADSDEAERDERRAEPEAPKRRAVSAEITRPIFRHADNDRSEPEAPDEAAARANAPTRRLDDEPQERAVDIVPGPRAAVGSEDKPRRAERERSDLLEIPAFLRRQAN